MNAEILIDHSIDLSTEICSHSDCSQTVVVGAQGSAYQIAEVYAFSGQPDKAFEWLMKMAD